MIDRDKVIDELNTDVLPFLQHHCDMKCDREKRWISKMIITVNDTITLLKEHGAEMIKCKNCMNEINKNDWNFCPYCGKCLPHLEGADDE